MLLVALVLALLVFGYVSFGPGTSSGGAYAFDIVSIEADATGRMAGSAASTQARRRTSCRPRAPWTTAG